MRNPTRLRRLLAVTILAVAGVSWSALPGLAVPDVVLAEDIVFRGGPGESRTFTWTNDPTLVGQTCTVTAVVDNGESEHEGNVLDVGPLRAVEIESAPWSSTTLTGTLTLAATNSAVVTLSSDPAHAWRPPTDRRPGVWVFSGTLTVTVDCDQGGTTSTSTSTVPPTTPTTGPTPTSSTTTDTTAPPTTTTIPTSTSSSPPATSTTTVPTPSTSVPDLTTTTMPPGTTPSTPPSTIPPVTGSTLPFTGPPADTVGVAMAAAALLLLGGGALLAAREGRA